MTAKFAAMSVCAGVLLGLIGGCASPVKIDDTGIDDGKTDELKGVWVDVHPATQIDLNYLYASVPVLTTGLTADSQAKKNHSDCMKVEFAIPDGVDKPTLVLLTRNAQKQRETVQVSLKADAKYKLEFGRANAEDDPDDVAANLYEYQSGSWVLVDPPGKLAYWVIFNNQKPEYPLRAAAGQARQFEFFLGDRAGVFAIRHKKKT